ncbi:esterase-like activity of phytase family protein [Glutamicibacter mishrai]|uniref:Esterase-like activity of phytase family protein n=1 Tax=Glutamicibacter mishrai TaxID=1775880 RepID=A0A6H0SDV8_9MICC|nr:esterase-like activity of phytase family protein [Glutamicibacter mishrai]QIV85703.1 esterase-like activity of phytase family protein [Glutamicibacter mishrai]
MHRAAGKSIGLVAAAVLSASIASPAAADNSDYFERVATYPVYQNHPDGAEGTTAAEISTVSEDGKTLIYSDALSRSVGFVDISDPSNPKGLGLLGLHQLGSAEDEPTSVAAYGPYVFVVVNTSASYSEPSGRLDVVRIADRSLVHSFELPGQPDSIAISKDGAYAGIAIENERDEDAGDGGLPQAPAGAVAILDLDGQSPDKWSLREVPLTSGTPNDPQALPLLSKAGLDTPQDPEPEYVSINSKNQLAVTLQENNGMVIIDLPSGKLKRAFSTGHVDLQGIDTSDDGQLDTEGSLNDVPREPDAVAWLQDRYLATANEGDWKGGSRGFSIFDSRTGKVVWDSGNSFEHLAMGQGLFPEKRTDKKGTEPEGLAISRFNGVDYGFVASERANFVAVYDLSDPKKPRYLQTLPSTNGPEGILPIPERGLLAVASETDEDDVRSALSLYSIGADSPQFPQLASQQESLVPFGALSGLSPDPADPTKLYAVSDNAYAPRIYDITLGAPASVDSSIPVTGASTELDLEGLAAREDGGFWAAHEGAEGTENMLVEIDDSGAVIEEVPLPEEAVGSLQKQGLEGVTVRGSGEDEQVIFTLQREVPGEDFVRLGKYLPATGEFSWYGYHLEQAADGAWNGLSEITALPDGSYAVIERDNQVGPAAKHKAVYQVELPEDGERPEDAGVSMLNKKLAADVLPTLEATHGWTQEKLEGLAVAGGEVYVVTDNDAVDEATGETVFASLGQAADIFDLDSSSPSPTTEPSESPSSPAPQENEQDPEQSPESADPEESGKPEQSQPEREPQAEEQDSISEESEEIDAEQVVQTEREGDLADTGANSLWLIPVGLMVALLGAAAAYKSARGSRAKQ